MIDRSFAYMWLLLLVALSALPAHADWINLSGAMSTNSMAEFHVNDDQVRVVLEVYVNDLPTFLDLVPDNMLKAGVQRPDEAERMARFANETLAIVADEQTVLPAQLVVAEPRMRSERPNPYAGMINPMTRQPVKYPHCARTIPLHPKIAKEFGEYVDSVRAAGHARVFPELRKIGGRYGHYLSRAFGAYLRNKVKIKDPKKTFHSFRHTVTDTLWKAMVQESIIEELTGRAGKTETSRRYAKGYRVSTLYKEAVVKLKFKLP